MAEHIFGQGSSSDSAEERFVAEVELLHQANTLPRLSARVRNRIVNAALAAYRKARRWSEARRAAQFLTLCGVAAVLVSPLAQVTLPGSSTLTAHVESLQWAVADAGIERRELEWSSSSAWVLRHKMNLSASHSTPAPPARIRASTKVTRASLAVARAENMTPPDKLITALRSGEGWGAVTAFEAVRDRDRATIQRVFCSN